MADLLTFDKRESFHDTDSLNDTITVYHTRSKDSKENEPKKEINAEDFKSVIKKPQTSTRKPTININSPALMKISQ
jgi:hypothetical protein